MCVTADKTNYKSVINTRTKSTVVIITTVVFYAKKADDFVILLAIASNVCYNKAAR